MSLDAPKICELCGENIHGYGHRPTCPDAPREAPAEYHFCGRCKEHSGWDWDPDSNDFVSQCCGWPPVPVDPEPLDA